MKKTFLILFILLSGIGTFAQNKIEAEKMVNQGIADHDKGDYTSALAKYDQALALDKDNLFALVEKAYTLLAQKNYSETIKIAERAFATHTSGEELKTLYITYGNALDMSEKPYESLAAYDRGIKMYPNEQMLYFNKAITLRGLKKDAEALAALEKSIKLKPTHPGSHNAVSLILRDQGNVIGSLLACFRFFTLEPTGNRAAGVWDRTQELLKANVNKGDNKNINITLPSGSFPDTKKGEKVQANNFATAMLMLSMATALDFGDEFKNETDIQRFVRKFDAICSALAVSKKDNYGFLWDHYAPYFLELKAKGFSEVFANVAFASQQKAETSKYFNDNKAKLEEFATWSQAYKWNNN